MNQYEAIMYPWPQMQRHSHQYLPSQGKHTRQINGGMLLGNGTYLYKNQNYPLISLLG